MIIAEYKAPKLLAILSVGIVAGLILISVGELIRRRQREQFLQKISYTFINELKDHLAIWEKLLSNQPIHFKVIKALMEHTYWFLNINSIAQMEPMYFQIISFYFQSAFETFGNLNQNKYSEHRFKILYLMATQAYCCFGIYSSPKKAIRTSYLLKLVDIDRQLFALDRHLYHDA